MVGQRFNAAFAVAIIPAIECGPRDAELVQRALGRQMRLLDQLNDLEMSEVLCKRPCDGG
jgi:hypothetical protein